MSSLKDSVVWGGCERGCVLCERVFILAVEQCWSYINSGSCIVKVCFDFGKMFLKSTLTPFEYQSYASSSSEPAAYTLQNGGDRNTIPLATCFHNFQKVWPTHKLDKLPSFVTFKLLSLAHMPTSMRILDFLPTNIGEHALALNCALTAHQTLHSLWPTLGIRIDSQIQSAMP